MKRRRGRSWWMVLAGIGCFAVISYFAAGLAVAFHLKSASRRHPYDVFPEEYGLVRQDVEFTTEDNVRLVGWYLPSNDPQGPHGDAGVVIVHGHHGNMGRSWQVPLGDGTVVESNEFEKGVLALHEAGFHVLLFDLRNHGRSGEAPPVSLGLHEALDVAAAVDRLASQPGVNPRRIGVKGSSMGGASALLACAREGRDQESIRALWIDSTFASARDAISDVLEYKHLGMLKIGTLAWAGVVTDLDFDQVRPDASIREIRVPIQLVHSIDDTMLDYHHAIQLYEAASDAPCELWITKGYAHNLSWQDKSYQQRLVAFFADNL